MSGAELGPASATGLIADAEQVPVWLRALTTDVEDVARRVSARGGRANRILSALPRLHKQASVLVLFSGPFGVDPTTPGGVPADADVLLTKRATTLRDHGGQVAFPGGSRDPSDQFPVGTALREAVEETGVRPESVRPLAVLPSFPVPPSGFDVVPVVAHWLSPHEVGPVDSGETARVVRVRLADLMNPANRFQVRRTVLGGRLYVGPAFLVDELLVWGFTGGLLAAISATAGWDIPWDTQDVRDLRVTLDSLENR